MIPPASGAREGTALRLRERSFGPEQRLVMAIVNRTPDSFYDRGATWDEAAAMERVHTVVAEGADIVDIGGVPAAPGAEVTVAEEIRRTVPFVAAVRAAYPDLVISVDAYRHQSAGELCAAGADLINDTWGGWDERLPEVAASCGAGLVCSHRRRLGAADPPVPAGIRRRDGGRAGADTGPGRPGRGPGRGPLAGAHRPGP